jgi:F0F1-type ATP synthase membrane subunit b/b'
MGMVFTVGNLLVIGIVLVILAIFRQLDRNSKTLDKVRRYAEKAKEELDRVVLERVQNLKDLAIELDIHQKAGKEILKRIQTIEEGIQEKFAAVDTIGTRIKDYDKVLSDLIEMTRRAEENIQRLKDESIFVDETAKKIKVLQSKLEAQEARIPELVRQFEIQNGKSLESVKERFLSATEKSISYLESRIAEAMTRTHELVLYLQNSSHKLREEAGAFESNARKTAEDLLTEVSQRLADLERSYHERLEEVAKKGELLETKALQKLKEHVEEKMRSTYRDLSTQIESEKAALKAQVDELETKIYQIEQDIETSLGEVRNNSSATISSLEEELRTAFEKQTGEMKDSFVSTRVDLEKSLAQFTEETLKKTSFLDEKIHSLDTHVQSYLQEVENRIHQGRQNLELFSQESIKRMDALAEELLKKQAETEASFKAKLASLDKVQQELTHHLEQLRSTLHSEVKTFEILMKKTYQEGEEKITRQGEELETRVLQRLESRLQEQEKEFSYRVAKIEEVSQEIDNLENNLRTFMERTKVRLQEDFANFGKQLHAERLRDQEEAAKAMAEIRNAMAELEKGLADLKTRAYENVSEKLKVFEDEFFQDLKTRDQQMQSKFMEWQSKVDGALDSLMAEEVNERRKIEERYTSELSSVLQDFQGRFLLQVETLNTTMEGFRKQTEFRIREFEKSLQEYRDELARGIEESKAASLTTFSEEFTRHQKVLQEEMERFEKEYENRLKGILDNFEAQKRELAVLWENLRSDVTLWQAKVGQDLKTSEAEITNQFSGFKVQISQTIGSLRDEFLKQKNDLIVATEEERKRLREELMSLQERFEALHQKLFGKLEESTKLLTLNLSEIEKKQRAFVEQTKIFDRADALKQSLLEQIEEMKRDLQRIEEERKELKETEAQFLRVKKLGEEATERLARFTAEKRRIDSIEEDFKRLMAMSEGIELKLRQVATSEDGIQSIQANLRSLQSLQQDVESRFERLEKKRKFIDLTLEGIDKNFQTLQEIERRIGSIEQELKELPDAVQTLGRQIQILSEGKTRAEETIQRISQIDALMKDLETRASNLLKAREWLAKTETRLQELSREAQDQVKLLGSLLKEGAKGPVKGDRGAPSLSARETVTKLAHQGWTVEQIATATKLSRGEVELILELSGKS